MRGALATSELSLPKKRLQSRLIGIDRQRAREAPARIGRAPEAHLGDAGGGVGNGVLRRKGDGRAEVVERSGAVLGFDAVAAAEEAQLDVVGLRGDGLFEEVQAAFGRSRALV